MLSAVLILTLGLTDEPYVQKIPGTLVSFKMLPIPAGRVALQDKTRHEVPRLWVAETEVTWDVFDVWAFRFDLTPAEAAAGVDAESRPSRPYGAPDEGFGHSGFAALRMTSHAAEEFCRWLSKKTGRKYRLPTEAEWEYAARGGSDGKPEFDKVAWFWENSDFAAHAVATKKPNAWGLHDMLGNVAEWAIGMDGKPVVCGGSYKDKVVDFTTREKQSPVWNQRDPQNPKSKWWLPDAPFVGFRVVCTE